jgi:hypothetical protein
VAALLDWNPNIVESLRLALAEIKETVMTGIQSPRYRQPQLHIHNNPIPELHSPVKKGIGQAYIPFREVI